MVRGVIVAIYPRGNFSLALSDDFCDSFSLEMPPCMQ